MNNKCVSFNLRLLFIKHYAPNIMLFPKVNNFQKTDKLFFLISPGNLFIILYQLTKFEASSYNTFRDIFEITNLPPLCCVLEQDNLLPEVLVIPRKLWLCTDMTEKWLTGMLNLNTNKQIILFFIALAKIIQLFYSFTAAFKASQKLRKSRRYWHLRISCRKASFSAGLQKSQL